MCSEMKILHPTLSIRWFEADKSPHDKAEWIFEASEWVNKMAQTPTTSRDYICYGENCFRSPEPILKMKNDNSKFTRV